MNKIQKINQHQQSNFRNKNLDYQFKMEKLIRQKTIKQSIQKKFKNNKLFSKKNILLSNFSNLSTKEPTSAFQSGKFSKNFLESS
jgi:hypothetical protein